MWYTPIQTDGEIKANRPDIVIKNKKEKNCLLIDMSIPTEKNTSVKVTERLSKYKDLEIEVQRMWGVKATTIPVVIGILGLIKEYAINPQMSKTELVPPNKTKSTTNDMHRITRNNRSLEECVRYVCKAYR